MAPRPTYEAPHVQLGALLVAARRRGLAFGEFWTEAVRPGKPPVMTNTVDAPAHCVRWPTDSNDRSAWMYAINKTLDSWRCVYERRAPTKAERAVGMLADSIGALDEVAADRAEGELDGLGTRAALPCAA